MRNAESVLVEKQHFVQAKAVSDLRSQHTKLLEVVGRYLNNEPGAYNTMYALHKELTK